MTWEDRMTLNEKNSALRFEAAVFQRDANVAERLRAWSDRVQVHRVESEGFGFLRIAFRRFSNERKTLLFNFFLFLVHP